MASEAADEWKMKAALQEIKRLDDIGSLIAYGMERNINMASCTTTQDMRDRLRYDLLKKNGLMKDLQVAEKLMRDIRDKDIERRSELSDIYAALKVTLRNVMKDKRLRAQLETEDVTTDGDYASTIERFRRSLSLDHCPIVLAGETSSGKSSLLNLFIGEDVLPVKLLSSTSAACELLYGEQRDGKLVSRNEHGVEIIIKEFPFEEKDQYLCKMKDRYNVSRQIVRLSVPLPFLQSGVNLVDTPGIGESSEMKQVLLDYVEKNTVYGFIYVIKSDNAGGVAKDRLQDLLAHLTNLKNEFGQIKVDPNTAIFICSRWDLVPDEEKEVVERDIIKKLKLCWPGFDPSRQLFKMNTQFAFNTLKAGYITDDYAALINGIQELLPMGLQRKLKIAYWWLEKVLIRLNHPVRVCLNRTRQTSVHLREKKRIWGDRVHQIRQDCDNFVREFFVTLQKDVEVIALSLQKHLSLPKTAEAVKMWGRNDLPREEDGDSWPIVRALINTVVETRLSDVIREWEEESQMMKKHQRQLLEFVSVRTKSLSEQLEDLEKLIRSTSMPELSGASGHAVKHKSELLTKLESLELPEDLDDANFFTDLRIIVSENSTMVSLRQTVSIHNILDTLSVPPSIYMRFVKRAGYRSLAEQNYKLYQRDRVKFLVEKSTAALGNIQDLGVVRQLVEGQFDDLISYVDDVKKQTPELLKANQDLLEAMIADKRSKGDILGIYQPIANQISELLERSATFSYKSIKEYKMALADVSSARTRRLSRKSSKGGLFASYDHGHILKDAKEVVTMKKYKENMRNIDKQHEEENIRSLTRKNPDAIPKLLAVMQETDLLPSLLFRGQLVPVRERFWSEAGLSRGVMATNHFRNCHNLITSLGRALVWLHTKRLVHMEISLDSVLVDTEERVKLTNLGEARVLRIKDKELTEPAGNYVYMPPEVLKGERYSSASDVYSLGIFIWEVWYDQQAFRKERNDRLHQFCDLAEPCRVMERGASSQLESSEFVRNMVQKCMQAEADSRPRMSTFQEEWERSQISVD